MSRRALIRKCLAPIHEPTFVYPKKKNGGNAVETRMIEIDCMHGCGDKVKVRVDAYSIDPKLGKPRGLHKSCRKCNRITTHYED